MYIDIIEYDGAEVTTVADTLYFELVGDPKDAYGFTQFQVNGNAPWGSKIGGHQRLRERFWIWYQRSGSSSTYRWTDVEFAQLTDSDWVTELTQNQQLAPEMWYLGSNHTNTFGSGGGQFDISGTDIDNWNFAVHTLTNSVKVEELAMSNLQGRLRFATIVAQDQIREEVLSYDRLWNKIYSKSALFQERLGRWYRTPLQLGHQADRNRLSEMVAKAVLVELWRSYVPILEAGTTRDTIDEWDEEVSKFLGGPGDLDGEIRSVVGGALRLERT